MRMRKPRVRSLKNTEIVPSQRKRVFKDGASVKVVTAPQEWFCDRCSAVIRKGEQCVKIGNQKVCAVHITRES